MDLILSESQFVKLLNEDLGVSRPAIAFSNLMYEKNETKN